MTGQLLPPRHAWLLALAVGAAACAGDGATEPAPGLSGSYQLVSLTQQGLPTVSAPFVSGTLELTEDRYTLDLTINVPGMEQRLQDVGTYVASGTHWSQVSDAQGGAEGSYRLEAGLLTVDMPYEGVPVVMIWTRVD